MSLFDKRPLGLILCIMMSGFSISALLPKLFGLILISVATLFSVLSLFLKALSGKLTKIALFSLLCSLLLSFVYFNYIFYPTKYYDKESSIVAKVEDVDIKNDFYKIVDIDVLEINGKNNNYKFKLNLYGEHNDIAPGSVISFTSVIQNFNSDSDFNFRHFYASKGFSATCEASCISLLRDEQPMLSYRFKVFRQNITKYVSTLSDDFAGALFGALFLGEKKSLDGQLLLDFQRIGISHILALSGLHVAILMGGLDRLLYLFGIRKKFRIILGMIASLLFMMLTGFPLSVTRAGVMLIISSALYLITGCKDSVTSLFVAVTLILTVSPFAAFDIGLWLSAIATLGILSAGEFVNLKYSDEKGIKRFLRYIYTSAIFSLFAIAASSAISALSFSGTSVISVFSTLIFSVLVEIYVYFGIAVLFFGKVIPIGTIFARYASFISGLAGDISDTKFIFGSLNFIIVKIGFVLLCALFVLFIVLKIQNKARFIAVLALCYVFLSVLTVSMTELYCNDDKFIAASASGDRILIKSEGKTFLLDSSSHRKSDAYYSNSLLTGEKITELDYYMVANYSSYLSDSLDVILRNTKTENVLLPIPSTEDDELIAIECFKIIERYRSRISFYSDTEVTVIGEYEILVPVRSYSDNSFAFTFKHKNEICSYLSSGVLENTPYSAHLLFASDKIIFGDYGTAYTNDFVIDEFDQKLREVILFDNKIFFDFSYIDWQAPEITNSKNKTVIYD